MKCIACGAPAAADDDERLCPDCRAEVDERAREMVDERMNRKIIMRGRVRR